MRSLASLVVVATLAGCDPPGALVICHNANCAGSADPADDDELTSLAASLALTRGGRPLLDGVELDLYWSRARGSCVYAHDAGQVERAPPASAPADLVAAFLRDHPSPTFHGDRFTLFLELKGTVARGTRHTASERASLAACAFDVVARIGGKLHVVFDSAEPQLLRALVAEPRWRAVPEEDAPVTFALSADFGSLVDGPDTQPLAAFHDLPLGVISLHPEWTTRTAYEAYRSLGVELCVWSYATTAATLDAVQRHAPRYILTGEARFVRAWLER